MCDTVKKLNFLQKCLSEQSAASPPPGQPGFNPVNTHFPARQQGPDLSDIADVDGVAALSDLAA